jgi:hypothetical protein
MNLFTLADLSLGFNGMALVLQDDVSVSGGRNEIFGYRYSDQIIPKSFE